MKGTAGSRSIEPAIGAAATHLTINDDATGPRAMTFVAVLTLLGGLLASNVREQSFNIAATRQVEALLGATLVSQTHTGLVGQSLRQCALYNDVRVAGLMCVILSSVYACGIRSHVRKAMVLVVGVLNTVREDASSSQV